MEKSTKFNTRIDVLFKNVGAIHLPTLTESLEIPEITQFELEEPLQLSAARFWDWKLFQVRTDDFKG